MCAGASTKCELKKIVNTITQRERCRLIKPLPQGS
jgi:hypothetical protein